MKTFIPAMYGTGSRCEGGGASMSATVASCNWARPKGGELSGVTQERESLGQLRLKGREFGRAASGPALAAYADWIDAERATHNTAFTLYLEPACSRLRLLQGGSAAPGEVWLPDATATLMLAALEHTTIHQQMLAIAAAFTGLTARQLFARFHVPAPAAHVLEDLGLTDDAPLGFGAEELTRRFLQAFRWDFYRAAARLRGHLFRQFIAAGLKPGLNVAVVDLASHARLPHLAARVLSNMVDVEVRAYSFILTEAAATSASRARFPFLSFAGEAGLPPDLLATARERESLFELALNGAAPATDEESAFHSGLDEGVRVYRQETRPDVPARDLLMPLFTRLCAPRPDFPAGVSDTPRPAC